MEEITTLLISWGLVGLIIAAFTESFCSPILPDILLIPLALSQPTNAIYYGLVATIVSVIGGGVGYGIGHKIGLTAVHKIIPIKYAQRIESAIQDNAKWAIFLAAMSPIPYKFISITAGAMKIDLKVFMIISFLGRGKRFLLEGILIYYYGQQAVTLFTNHKNDLLIASLAVLVIGGFSVYWVKRLKKNVVLEKN